MFEGNNDRRKIEEIIIELNKIAGNTVLYGEDGKVTLEAFSRVSSAINNYCFLQGNFSIGEMGGKLTINDSMVESPNPGFAMFVSVLRAHFINGIVFSAGVGQDEIKSLIKILNIKPAEISKERIAEEIGKAGFKHIILNKQSIELVMDGGFDAVTVDDFDKKVGRGKQILVVEDNVKLQAMYKEELTDRGFEVKLTTSGQEALNRIFDQNPPDLMILDIKMAGMTGIEVLEKMKMNKKFIPVIIATAYPSMKDDFIIKTFPDLELIIKPFSYDSLAKLIGKLLVK